MVGRAHVVVVVGGGGHNLRIGTRLRLDPGTGSMLE